MCISLLFACGLLASQTSCFWTTLIWINQLAVMKLFCMTILRMLWNFGCAILPWLRCFRLVVNHRSPRIAESLNLQGALAKKKCGGFIELQQVDQDLRRSIFRLARGVDLRMAGHGWRAKRPARKTQATGTRACATGTLENYKGTRTREPKSHQWEPAHVPRSPSKYIGLLYFLDFAIYVLPKKHTPPPLILVFSIFIVPKSLLPLLWSS